MSNGITLWFCCNGCEAIYCALTIAVQARLQQLPDIEDKEGKKGVFSMQITKGRYGHLGSYSSIGGLDAARNILTVNLGFLALSQT